MLAEQSINQSVKESDPKLGPDEKEALLVQVDGWQIKNSTYEYLEKRFEFSNFVKAQVFVNKVSELAEEANHHPEIRFGWGYAEICWWTHTLDGLHLNDFIMAARTNLLVKGL